MLIKASTLKGYKLHCLDGELGAVREFYFDDQHWTIRYLVANTGSWLTGRQVLISPYALVAVLKADEQIAVNLTKKQIEESPLLNSDQPVSKQFEESYYGYYGWPMYWGGPFVWGASPSLVRNPEMWPEGNQGGKAWDPHLRSTHAVHGYHIQALDGELGHVEDFIIEDETWSIRYLVVATRNWWPGKKVLISPDWIERVSWTDQKVFANLSREAIRHSPEYTADSLITREYETGLFGHYQQQGYWLKDHSKTAR
ncbi:MAG TPA: PRC-barrel domain-containing protein [Candidatus Limnocylindria bacterium]|jgi:hypothetical protein|nr:PRC-barrel domain-containing protein [Candidatus Limnocylindria bacterium]